MLWAPVRQNPFLSTWLSAANTMAGAGRGLWMAELHRHQAAMLAEFGQQTLRFWSAASLPQPAPRSTRSDTSVTEASTTLVEPGRTAERDASGDAQAQPEVSAEPEARAADAPQRKAPDSTEAQPKAPAKRPAAQLRTTVVRRTSAPKAAKPKTRAAAPTKRKARSAR